MNIKIPLLLATVIFSGCTATKYPVKSEAYKQVYEEKPVVILAMPPINKSTKVDAKELFYSSLAVPLTQKGYYVMPPLLTMEILKEESAYDAELFLDSSMKQVGQVFGADAVLFTIIHDWSKVTIAAQIIVNIEYILKSTKTDEILFNRKGNITLNVSNSGGLIGLAASMIATSLKKEIIVGRSCNIYTLSDMPAGKYSPDFMNDGTQMSGPKELDQVITQSF